MNTYIFLFKQALQRCLPSSKYMEAKEARANCSLVGNRKKLFPLMFLCLVGLGLGLIFICETQVKAYSGKPYIAGVNSVRMQANAPASWIDTSITNGTTPTVPFSNRLALEPASVAVNSLRQQISYTHAGASEISAEEVMLPTSGLITAGKKFITLLTDTGEIPVGHVIRDTPSLLVVIPGLPDVPQYAPIPPLPSVNKLFYIRTFDEGLMAELRYNFGSLSDSLRYLAQKNGIMPRSTSKGKSKQYWGIAERYANRYDLTPELILAIIRAESNFNPSAVSQRNAIGLMQIVPETAGGEVHKYLTGENSTPSEDMLFHPDSNIKYGTAYLHLLQTRYFQDIESDASRCLCVIAAYNGGPGAVLRAFDQSPGQAIALINTMTPDEVYTALKEKLPRYESRLYVDRVLGHMESLYN